MGKEVLFIRVLNLLPEPKPTYMKLTLQLQQVIADCLFVCKYFFDESEGCYPSKEIDDLVLPAML